MFNVKAISIDVLDITFLTVSVCSTLSSGRTSDNSALLVSTKFSLLHIHIEVLYYYEEDHQQLYPPIQKELH